MSAHEQFAEDLALYALGALAHDDRAGLEAHLAECPSCRLELEQLRGDSALLALSTIGPKPPVRARERLLKAVSLEPAISSDASDARYLRKHRPWWGSLGWVTAAAAAACVVVLWLHDSSLNQRFSAQQRRLMEQQVELQNERNIVSTLTATDSMKFSLVTAKAPPKPEGKAFYLRNRSSLVFMADNMPSLPAQKAYQLWIIPVQGTPIPAGTFRPDGRGTAMVINPAMQSGNVEAKAFAVTVEDAAGASTPTMPILMMGAGE